MDRQISHHHHHLPHTVKAARTITFNFCSAGLSYSTMW